MSVRDNPVYVIYF